jgi:hypothetical protein
MSKVYEAVMRAQRERDSNLAESGGLRDRLLGWIPGRRAAEVSEPRPVVPQIDIDLDQLSSRVDASVALQEKLSSLQVTVDALDNRISSEIVEREAKLLEAISRGINGLETELLERLATTGRELKRSIRLTAALGLGVCVLIAAITIGALLIF